MSKWISVKDKLPEPFESVLVHIPKEKPLPTVYEGFITNYGRWYTAYYARSDDEITHWMPFPEPPKEVE